MANLLSITRRAALIGGLLTPAALALPGRGMATPPTDTALDRFHAHFAGLVAAMDELAGDADGWALQCGRVAYTSGPGPTWHNQQRHLNRMEPVRPGQDALVQRSSELVIGKVMED